MKKRHITYLLMMMIFANLSCGELNRISGIKQSRQAASQPKIQVPEPSCSGVEPGKTGTLVADTGFRPKPNGFRFPNYGANQYPFGDLTSDDARQIFGDVVCKTIKNGKCVPTPVTQLWIDRMNQAMGSGHCEGMAVLSAWFFTEQKKLQPYKTSTAFTLQPSEASLMKAIAINWTLQTLEPVVSESRNFRTKTPTEILDTLVAAMKKGDWYTLGIYGASGGHAITPYAVEDIGNGIFWIHVYDNNYPCGYKYVEVNTTTNTWTYAGAAINPTEDSSPWSGSTGTIDLTSLSVRQQPVECPFCSETGCQKESALAILLTGKGSMLSATDKDGKSISMKDGQAVSDIPGATLIRLRGVEVPWGEEKGALLILPPNQEYSIHVVGTTNKAKEPTSIGVFQSCKSYVVSNIQLDPGQDDRLTISGDGKVSYTAGDREAPTFEIGINNPTGNDTLEVVDGVTVTTDGSFSIETDFETGEISFSSDNPEAQSFDLDSTVVDINGDATREVYNDVEIEENGEATLDISEDGSGELNVDTNGDGTVDEENIQGEEEEPASSDEEMNQPEENTPDDQNTDDNSSDETNGDNSDSGSSDSGDSDSGDSDSGDSGSSDSGDSDSGDSDSGDSGSSDSGDSDSGSSDSGDTDSGSSDSGSSDSGSSDSGSSDSGSSDSGDDGSGN